MKTKKLLALFITAILISCSPSDDATPAPTPKPTPKPNPTPEATTLKAAASFPIGMIVSAGRLSGSDTNFTTILNTEFNSVTAENDMKMAEIFKGPNNYDFTKGDAIVAYAKANGLRVHGHALVWHSSIPYWLQNYSGTDAEFEILVRDYIKATVSHFASVKTTAGKSVVESWDVVNEAFTNEAYAAVFYKRMGVNYVSKCFKWAREADANVKLFYNDYNIESQGSKASSVVTMVNDFKANATPIDGIGLQMHVDYSQPSLATLTSNLGTIIGTGLLVHFSELDMTVNKDKSLASLSQERSNAQKAKYQEIATLYKSIPAAQRFGITVWGLRDNDSWLLSFYGNTNEWPLLFNSNYGKKDAYNGFLAGLK
jgi:endo-1,4-beta-xylanase